MPVANANGWRGDVRSDWRDIERDSARPHAEQAGLRYERGEVRAAEIYENWALRHGRLREAWRAELLERREAADVRALE
jgi:hypothetical protein